jgi:hypothetical protein
VRSRPRHCSAINTTASSFGAVRAIFDRKTAVAHRRGDADGPLDGLATFNFSIGAVLMVIAGPCLIAAVVTWVLDAAGTIYI